MTRLRQKRLETCRICIHVGIAVITLLGKSPLARHDLSYTETTHPSDQRYFAPGRVLREPFAQAGIIFDGITEQSGEIIPHDHVRISIGRRLGGGRAPNHGPSSLADQWRPGTTVSFYFASHRRRSIVPSDYPWPRVRLIGPGYAAN